MELSNLNDKLRIIFKQYLVDPLSSPVVCMKGMGIASQGCVNLNYTMILRIQWQFTKGAITISITSANTILVILHELYAQ